MFGKIKRSIKAQVWLLFAIIFASNILAVSILLNGQTQNKTCVADIQHAVTQSQEISKITAAHVEWVNNLSAHLSSGTEFTGSLDPSACSFGKWLANLNDELKNDSVIASAIWNIEAPHTLIHNQAGSIIELNKTDHAAAIDELENSIYPNVLKIIKELTIIANRCNEIAVESSTESSATLQENSMFQIIIIVFVLIVSVVIALVIIKMTINPTVKTTKAAESLARGELDIKIDIKGQNEMGRMAASLNKAIALIKTYINDIDAVMQQLSVGNFTATASSEFVGDFKHIQVSITKFIEEMTTTLSSIDTAADQVASGANLVSQTSMALSQGATEQASSVEQLTASIQEIAAQTARNAENAQSANQSAKNAKADAELGNAQMSDMLGAMEDINQSSASINKIIKVIDDIAFQTNILALNAAVEAARAGQHGKGFAVVAEEVRTLAARSAQAAKETTDLIEGSIKRVEAGTRIASQTAAALGKIVTEVAKAASLVEEIAVASNEQSLAIEQVNQGVVMVSSVVQSNAATSEESAAASEELSSQADQLKEIISTFKIKQNTSMSGLASQATAVRRTDKLQPAGSGKAVRSSKPAISLGERDFGKY